VFGCHKENLLVFCILEVLELELRMFTCSTAARKGRPEKKQTDCVLRIRQEEGMAKERDKT
jgi:hypothetical protein